jgi:iron complex outermembrane receptor protein
VNANAGVVMGPEFSRGIARVCVSVATVLMASTAISSVPLVLSAPASAQAAQTTYSIPAGPLNRALAAFGRQSGLQVVYVPSIAAGKSSSGITGTASPAQAVARLLQGTGLSFSFPDARTVAVSAPSTSAAGGLPSGTIPLDTIDVQGAENAWGPVNGYVAKQSATGTKTDTPLIETPQSITVIGRQQMEDQGVQTLPQALRYVPGVFAETQGAVQNGYDAFKLRAFDAVQYLDGLQTQSWAEPYGLERIEVLRGPTSVLYGQGEPGGIVNMVSKRPTATPIHEVGVLTSNYGGVQGYFDLGGKLNQDGTLLYRLTGLGKDLGSQFDGDPRYKRLYIAPAVTWRPDTDTTLTILAKYQYDPGYLALPVVNAYGSIFPRPDGRVFGPRYYGSDPAFDAGSYRKNTQIGYAFERRLGEIWTVRQNLRYTYDENNRQILGISSLNAPPATSASRSATHAYSEINQFAVDTNAQAKFATGPLFHTALFGVDYRNTRTLSEQGQSFAASIPRIDFFNPVYTGYSGPVPPLTSGSLNKLAQTGLYAQDQIKLGGWSLLFGGRYDWANSDTYNPYANGARTDQSDQHAFTKRIGLTYEFSNGVAPYVSYAESFAPQSGTTSPQRGSKPFDPTTGEQYEAGIKYQPTFFDGFFTAAVYDLRKQNVLATDPQNVLYQVQTGEIRSRGVELSATTNVTANLKILASYSYTDNIVTKDNPNAAGISMVGKAPYGFPTHLASGWVDYTFSEGALAGLGLGGGVRYLGSNWGDSANTFKVPAVTLFDAAIRYDFGKKWPDLKGLTGALNAQNLFDKAYVQACTNGMIFCYYGAARTVTASLSYKW